MARLNCMRAKSGKLTEIPSVDTLIPNPLLKVYATEKFEEITEVPPVRALIFFQMGALEK